MPRIASVLGVSTMLLAFTATAHGQTPPPDRWFVHVNAAGQASSDELGSRFVFPLYEEDATVSVTRKPKGALFDLTAGTWVIDRWIPRLGPGTFGAGITFSRRGGSSDGALTASLPDPAEHDQHRDVTGSVTGLEHSETWVAPQIFYRMRVPYRITVTGFIGPAFASIDSDTIPSVNVTEGESGPTVDAIRGSTGTTFTGISVGVDAQYPLTRQFNMDIGAGAFMRYQGASGTLAGRDYTAGGAQFGVGLRLGF